MLLSPKASLVKREVSATADGGIDAEQLDKLCKIRLLQNQFAALQRGTPFGDAIFLLVKKDSRERHAKGPFVLWNLR